MVTLTPELLLQAYAAGIFHLLTHMSGLPMLFQLSTLECPTRLMESNPPWQSI